MKYIRYSKYTGEPADAVDLEELIKRLGDFFLQSGFESQYLRRLRIRSRKDDGSVAPGDPARARRKATCCPKILLEQLTQEGSAKSDKELRELIDRLIQRMMEEGYIKGQLPQVTAPPEKTPRGQVGGQATRRIRRASKSPTRPSTFSASGR